MHRLAAPLLCSLIVAAACVPPAPAAAPPPYHPEFSIDHQGGRVVRRSPGGRDLWATRLEGVGNVSRSPDLVWDDDRVYAAHADGVTALDPRTGKVVWKSEGPHDRLLLDRTLILAADCRTDEAVGGTGRWLVARSTADGEVAFRVRLPLEGFDPYPIRRVAGLFLVQSQGDPGGKSAALLFDRRGKVRHRLDRVVLDGRRGDDVVLLTSSDVIRLGGDGRQRWAAAFEEGEWIAGGGMVGLEGGDVVAFLYGCISDSGVQVAHLDAATGKAAWRARCAPLGVDHSKYFHEASSAVEGARVRVTSKGASGTFVEVLDLKSGVRLSRKSDLE